MMFMENHESHTRALHYIAAAVDAAQHALPHERLLVEAVSAWVRHDPLASLGAFDAALDDLNRWRVSHRERGAVYLRGDGREHVMASTGTQLDAGTPHEQAFRDLMNERIEETRAQTVGPGHLES